MTLLSKNEFVTMAGNVATLLFIFFVGVQLLVAASVLPVTIVQGGGQTELTLGLRLASLGAAALLLLFTYVIRYRAGLLGSLPQPVLIKVLAWAVTGFMALNTLGNFLSVNPIEQMLFGPLAIVMFLACSVVSASKLN